MNTYATLALIACCVAACDKPTETSTTRTTGAAVPAAGDNAQTNAHDRSGAVTPIDQGNDNADLKTTQAIRRSLMADDMLSFDAKNVKIVTKDGAVTLSGHVRNAYERQDIESKAEAAAGSNRVDCQLEVGSDN